MGVTPNSLRTSLQHFGLQRDRLRAALSRATGIPETDLEALEQLESDGPLTPKELADRLQLTSGGATVLADRLERAGWVKRRPHPSDRRSLLLELDAGALAQTPNALTDYHAAVTAASRAVAPEHRQALADFLASVSDAAAHATHHLQEERRQRRR